MDKNTSPLKDQGARGLAIYLPRQVCRYASAVPVKDRCRRPLSAVPASRDRLQQPAASRRAPPTSRRPGESGRRNHGRWGPTALEKGERGPRSTAQTEQEPEPAMPVLAEQALLDCRMGTRDADSFPLYHPLLRQHPRPRRLDRISGPTGAITAESLANLAAPRSLPGALAALACEHAGLGNLGNLGKPWAGHLPPSCACSCRPAPAPAAHPHTRPSIGSSFVNTTVLPSSPPSPCLYDGFALLLLLLLPTLPLSPCGSAHLRPQPASRLCLDTDSAGVGPLRMVMPPP